MSAGLDEWPLLEKLWPQNTIGHFPKALFDVSNIFLVNALPKRALKDQYDQLIMGLRRRALLRKV